MATVLESTAKLGSVDCQSKRFVVGRANVDVWVLGNRGTDSKVPANGILRMRP